MVASTGTEEHEWFVQAAATIGLRSWGVVAAHLARVLWFDNVINSIFQQAWEQAIISNSHFSPPPGMDEDDQATEICPSPELTENVEEGLAAESSPILFSPFILSKTISQPASGIPYW